MYPARDIIGFNKPKYSTVKKKIECFLFIFYLLAIMKLITKVRFETERKKETKKILTLRVREKNVQNR